MEETIVNTLLNAGGIGLLTIFTIWLWKRETEKHEKFANIVMEESKEREKHLNEYIQSLTTQMREEREELKEEMRQDRAEYQATINKFADHMGDLTAKVEKLDGLETEVQNIGKKVDKLIEKGE